MDDAYIAVLNSGNEFEQLRSRGVELAELLAQPNPVLHKINASVSASRGICKIAWSGYEVVAHPRVVNAGRTHALEWRFTIGSDDNIIECARFYLFSNGEISADVAKVTPITDDRHGMVAAQMVLLVLDGLLKSAALAPTQLQ